MLPKCAAIHMLLMLVFIIVQAVLRVEGGGYLWIKLVDFVNPGGKGDNRHPCDGKYFFKTSKCDHKFIICIDGSSGYNSVSRCPYGRRDTGEVSNMNTIKFGSVVGGIRNPFTFRFNRWPGSVKIKVEIWDVDDNNDDYVDFLKLIYTTVPTKGRAFSYLLRSRTRLQMLLKFYCEASYYGSDCATYCVPRNDSFGHYTCNQSTGKKICNKGWKGVDCTVTVDACASSPCQNGGICHSNRNGYVCVCADGYEGINCESEANECESSPCGMNGNCTDIFNGYKCSCTVGWTGTTCSTDIDYCLSNPCSNNGSCIDGVSDYKCVCGNGWTGPTCLDNINECDNSPCYNNASCVDTKGHFRCLCQNGFKGILCDKELDDCHSNPCENGGNCTALNDGFMCECVGAWTGPTCGKRVKTFKKSFQSICSDKKDSSEIEVDKGEWSISEKDNFVAALKILICKYGGLNTDTVKIDAFISQRQDVSNAISMVSFDVYENGDKICADDIDKLLMKFDENEKWNLRQILSESLIPRGRSLKTPQAQKSWIKSNLYPVIGVALVCLTVCVLIVAYLIVRKRKRKLVMNNRGLKEGESTEEFSPISFENVLYAQSNPSENSRMNMDYTFEE